MMSFNPYQQFKVNKLLETDFKKIYDQIPESFKSNFYFQYFLCELASLEEKIDQAQLRKHSLCKQNPDCEASFRIDEEKDGLFTTANYLMMNPNLVDKEKVKVVLYPDGTLSFSWSFAFVFDFKKYTPATDDTTYELTMRESKDKDYILTEYVISNCSLQQLEMVSIFDQNNNEIYRQDRVRNRKTNEILTQEEFSLVSQENMALASSFFDDSSVNANQILQMYDGKAAVFSLPYLQNINEFYIGKCTVNQDTRYAVCFKPSGFANEAYGKTFESITGFGKPNSNLFYTLDTKQRPYVKEISRYDYHQLIKQELNNAKCLKKASHYGK